MLTAPETFPPAKPAAEAQETTKTLILVDGEGPVRNLARMILEKSGYGVLDAGTERECLALCAQHQGPIDLLITDVALPEIGGIELATRVRQLRPGLKVLFISTQPRELVFADRALNGTFLQKPFAAVGLVEKAREALDAGV